MSISDFSFETQGNPFYLPLLRLTEQGSTYLVRYLPWSDQERQSEYQRLRARIFVYKYGWQIPVDAEGREQDHYDQEKNPAIRVYTVYGQDNQQEHLLGGLRIFELKTWNDSMIVNEFQLAGIIPETVIQKLKRYDCNQVLELTRYCQIRGHRIGDLQRRQREFSKEVTRDLVFASACSMAHETERPFGLALITTPYFRVLQRSGFVCDELYQGEGVALIMIDTWKTVRKVATLNRTGAERMLTLCA